MACDLCGANTPTRSRRVEGVVYNVCVKCAQFGSEVRRLPSKKKKSYAEDTRVVKGNAASIIRTAREKSGKKQKEFAANLGVKESLLHSWESGHQIPTIQQATQLEKKLHVSLLEQQTDVAVGSYSSGGSTALTIGDMIKNKLGK